MAELGAKTAAGLAKKREKSEAPARRRVDDSFGLSFGGLCGVLKPLTINATVGQEGPAKIAEIHQRDERRMPLSI